MRAVVYRGQNDLRLETIPVPRIDAKELLVKVAACGVCPTDIGKIQYGTVSPPRIFGHETAGTIVQTGSRVRGFKVGDRVALHHHVPCLTCRFCRHRAFAQSPQYKKTGITAGFEPAGGGFAEYVRVMPFVLPGVVKIPAKNSFDEGAMLEPVNTVLKAVNRLSLLPGDNVLVAGQGPIGLMFTRILHLQGMNVLATDLLKSRLAVARKLGARWIFQVPSGKARGNTEPATPNKHALDAAVLAVPSESAFQTAITAVRGAGKILLFAHTRHGATTPVDLASICVHEKDLIGSYSADVTLQDETARLVFSRKLDFRQLITHRFPLERTAEAIQLAQNPGAESLKIVVVP